VHKVTQLFIRYHKKHTARARARKEWKRYRCWYVWCVALLYKHSLVKTEEVRQQIQDDLLDVFILNNDSFKMIILYFIDQKSYSYRANKAKGLYGTRYYQ